MRSEKLKTICSNDPGVDTTRVDSEAFFKHITTREDLDSIRNAFTAEGPTVFTVREIPHALWDFVDGGASDADKYKRAFMVGLEHAENVVQKNGTRLASVAGRDVTAIGTKQQDIMRESDLAYFSPAEVQEIGSVAYQHSFLHRKIESCFRLPPMCHRALAERDFRSAESNPTSQDKPSEPASASEAG